MKIIKIGGINWTTPGWENSANYYVGIYILSILNNLSNKYKYEYVEDPYKEECDIIIYSLWGNLKNLQKCKGNPKFIYWTHEYLAGGSDKKIWDTIYNNHPPFYKGKSNKKFLTTYKNANIIFNFYKQNNYSLSFNDNDEYNLYYPFWITVYDESIKLWKRSVKNKYRNILDKNKFCIFCSSHEIYYDSKVRINLVNELNNYKTVSCCGKALHNTGKFYLPFDDEKSQDYCKDHKFYISFENAKSFNDVKYITEKLLFGWRYSCVPLYWGDNRDLKYFNKEAFVDLSNCNQDEMIQKIIELDNDNDKAQYILNQYLFADKKINYKEIFDEQLVKFVENIIGN